MREGVFLLLVILPVYEFSLLIDGLLLNSIEFWTGDKPVKERYDWPHAGIIEFCNEAPRYFGQIRGELNDRKGRAAYDDAAVTRALDDLLRKRILYEEKGRYLTLALPVNQSF
jgi:hypothetical protein